MDKVKCRFCRSEDFVRYGNRYKKNEKVQIYKCGKCNRRFTHNSGFLYTEHTKEIITLALDLYFKGLSLRKVSDHVRRHHDIKVSYVTILFWIRRYTKLIKAYTDQFIVDAPNTWHIDEMVIDVDGKQRWLWNLMDNKSRFFIAVSISNDRCLDNAMKILKEGLEKTQQQPEFLITDSLRTYVGAYRRLFDTNKTLHLPYSKQKKSERVYNNLIERLNGSVRERTKVTRGYKTLDGAQTILDGWLIYYNYIRKHEALNGKTPAEAVGINLDLGKNGWLDLIKQSKEAF